MYLHCQSIVHWPRHKSRQPAAYYLLGEIVSESESNLDVWDVTDALRVNPEVKHQLNGDLDDGVGKAARRAAPREL